MLAVTVTPTIIHANNNNYLVFEGDKHGFGKFEAERVLDGWLGSH